MNLFLNGHKDLYGDDGEMQCQDNMKTFPILSAFHGWRKEVPFDFVAPHESQAKRNHYQSLKKLAERGGLSPVELYAVIRGLDWTKENHWLYEMEDSEAENIIDQWLNEDKKTEKEKHTPASKSELSELLAEKRELLADYAHEAWSGWMAYLYRKSTINKDGTMIIPKWAVDRWTMLINTPYKELPEEMKKSDREEADKIIKIFNG